MRSLHVDDEDSFYGSLECLFYCNSGTREIEVRNSLCEQMGSPWYLACIDWSGKRHHWCKSVLHREWVLMSCFSAYAKLLLLLFSVPKMNRNFHLGLSNVQTPSFDLYTSKVCSEDFQDFMWIEWENTLCICKLFLLFSVPKRNHNFHVALCVKLQVLNCTLARRVTAAVFRGLSEFYVNFKGRKCSFAW